MTDQANEPLNEVGVLRRLRGLIPERALGVHEALRVADLQAARLLQLVGVTDGPVPDDVVLSLPRIERRFHQLRAASGMTYWNGRVWVIGVNSTEPHGRQRMTLFHEFKHIIDHGHATGLYRGTRYVSAERQAEQAADYFAGCVLMPKVLLSQAWYGGVQRTSELARRFEVTERAVEVRLSQLGLRTDLPVEHRPAAPARLPQRPKNWYFRSTAPVTSTTEVASCPN